MARPISTVFTDNELELIEHLIVRAQNSGDASLATPSDVVRHAVLAYLDFRDRLDAGELDGLPSAALLLQAIPALDPTDNRRSYER